MNPTRRSHIYYKIFSLNKCQNVSYSKTTKSSYSGDLRYDIIGPPDPVSNLRQIKFYQHVKETLLEKKYRELRADTQIWNQAFWNSHNQRFVKERQTFISKNLTDDKTSLNADEMSLFYKSFLDNNWKLHVDYNLAWYKRNITIFCLAVQVNIEKFKNKLIL